MARPESGETDWETGLTRLEEWLGWRFRDRRLLAEALTHRSFANERGGESHYERLEFLGDAVLGLLAAEWLFVSRQGRSEGELSREKAYLISEPVLARHGAAVGLGPLLRLGVGEERSGGREKPSLLADAVEALLGALFLDGGLAPVREVGFRLLAEAASWERAAVARDPKTALQEAAQARGWELPSYETVAEEGPDHAKRFTVACRIGERAWGQGSGLTKKAAEQAAAADALAALAREAVPAGDASP
ncbi:MAG: ribonuclease III [Thermoanaerobaculia bacterium]|nr:ribonuclease III [Thermoanaerobaculia bacterium]MCZ7650701.1 ribonuclease III [Thermoanaerobaculia bacterium]